MEDLTVRQAQILALVHRDEYCAIEALSHHFSVTTQTIRRDINTLCSMGLARRHHGGVGLPATLSNRSYLSRQATDQTEKRLIAERVAPLIPDGSTVFLGIGTTIALIAERLVHHQELRVVTNNFEAAHILSHHEHIEIWLPEGRIRSHDGDIVGDHVSQFFSRFSADIGIVGCAAVSRLTQPPKPGRSETELAEFAMEYELREAAVSQAIVHHSQQKWLVASQAKWQRKANAKVIALNRFDRIFTAELSQDGRTDA
ncbi:DeoR/GlpR family DNA-binding transcription regulator [Vibrio gazogenes]|uniref:Transcriptional regulator, DeoR family n=1 Tax=Vibrio gazogenes DSM 21264 = NBRC 103151 TaxID=1123492 RepID=A0A1M4V694_VIBGA|nr:DeoR/GlpR family DNA-binding transcription regulator [Vibrio gazogenes]USP15610.1 DeoR/GlpR family DNA-binding transcription regulator [Vibrio gazogenes]SHE64393.1 transcriptional regulator, DeoR family [Vibrio gazogenes DSM 21264] [Vibrio gazogenes DSM 21264 = NBRC 103151]SJN54624.1 Glycerol-3-phosphate regulon repressor [Vibrio gazogenes]